MKRLAALTAAGILVFGVAAGAEAHQRYGKHRHFVRDPGVTAFWAAPGFSLGITFPGAWYPPPRRVVRPPRKVWVPGYWEYSRVWVPGRYERFGSYGERHRHDRWERHDRRHRHERRDHRWERKRYGGLRWR